MGERSTIEWTDATWNPVTGCTKVSPGCDNCYAERITKRWGRDFSEMVLHPERLEQPIHWKKPRMIFTCSMSDLFHPRVTAQYLRHVFNSMLAADRHTYQVLTKRPGRMAWFADLLESDSAWWPDNVWAGTSVESQKYAPRLDVLARVPAKVRFLSAEPLLGPLDLTPWLKPEGVTVHGNPGLETRGALAKLTAKAYQKVYGLQWVIVGGESGPGARPMNPDWARSIVVQCKEAGVPVFVKQMGSCWAMEHGCRDVKGGDIKRMA